MRKLVRTFAEWFVAGIAYTLGSELGGEATSRVKAKFKKAKKKKKKNRKGK